MYSLGGFDLRGISGFSKPTRAVISSAEGIGDDLLEAAVDGAETADEANKQIATVGNDHLASVGGLRMTKKDADRAQAQASLTLLTTIRANQESMYDATTPAELPRRRLQVRAAYSTRSLASTAYELCMPTRSVPNDCSPHACARRSYSSGFIRGSEAGTRPLYHLFTVQQLLGGRGLL